ncbi:peptidyl-prolyl cis-trans isomerase, putative [Candida dubliniensis CD36]|uniref:peptidylprolyl isomerase n=1 Tax=Candida dubliniensis (strain CD36 / ATCC MYA-646 / CBS 7987 / NCPF 3949 / NRRL Y-17841) TaxID=573826 RepID=B9W9U9_CANDC|nr:peptidyl-prolyl cis-trans isomerase, putative [Candida dubliniensis CD36]CAX45586.1 peptidyl-prolyl cis-trans isomerase, putative [Candida dubliniensis CD36]
MKTSFISLAAIVLTQLFPSVSATASPDELKIKILKSVECKRKTKSGDFISVHYSGKLEDGTEFDSSFSRGTPLPFNLGSKQVITCWDEGLLDMCIGEKRELWCHPNVAYGSNGIGPIPPNSALIFTAELVDIAGVDKEEKVEKDEL